MIDYLKSRIIGQDHVFNAIYPHVKCGESEDMEEDELRGAFLFLGPTGTGKTETAKALADYLKIPLIRFDMSEYSNDPDYWLNDFADELEEHHNGIILLDEIEKGNMKIMDFFLQILSYAKIKVQKRRINLHNYYFIMTSNIGSKNILGEQDPVIVQGIIENMVKSYFRPEFLGRFRRKCIITFRPLQYCDMKRIVELKINQRINRYKEKGYDFTYDEKLIIYFVSYISPEFGARPLVDTIRMLFRLALIDNPTKTGKFTLVDNYKVVLQS